MYFQNNSKVLLTKKRYNGKSISPFKWLRSAGCFVSFFSAVFSSVCSLSIAQTYLPKQLLPLSLFCIILIFAVEQCNAPMIVFTVIVSSVHLLGLGWHYASCFDSSVLPTAECIGYNVLCCCWEHTRVNSAPTQFNKNIFHVTELYNFRKVFFFLFPIVNTRCALCAADWVSFLFVVILSGSLWALLQHSFFWQSFSSCISVERILSFIHGRRHRGQKLYTLPLRARWFLVFSHLSISTIIHCVQRG